MGEARREYMRWAPDWCAIVEQIKARVELAETERYAPTFREHAIDDVRTLLNLVDMVDAANWQHLKHLGRPSRSDWRRRRYERRERARQIRQAAERQAARAKLRSL